MTPRDMARLHSAAFVHDRGWSAEEFASLITQPYTTVFSAPEGFALTRTLAGESELLTLAVNPAFQRRSIAYGLMKRWLDTLDGAADTAFLEVAADNAGAIALYEKLDFNRTSLRRGYYARNNGPAVDALIMTKALT